jgi:hypothetical protein
MSAKPYEACGECMLAALKGVFYLYPVAPIEHHFAVIATYNLSDFELALVWNNKWPAGVVK